MEDTTDYAKFWQLSSYGKVHVDEFFVGDAEEGVFGRGSKNKRLVVVALEIVHEGFGRAYVEVIDDVSAKSFLPIL